ncbi:Protein kinase C-binding protein NELL1 [Liparis tanakae]|uniref:Protein kinase C-binding protein NELL1 n=1 Tax=Liparis tanakae TaxID=230148 RepID=A0A4Z2GAX4_9TELE|nr:Protein kinase C-binding protein NELL1 [Liparis tanakae]
MEDDDSGQSMKGLDGQTYCRRRACDCADAAVDPSCCPGCDGRPSSRCLDQGGRTLHRSGATWRTSSEPLCSSSPWVSVPPHVRDRGAFSVADLAVLKGCDDDDDEEGSELLATQPVRRHAGRRKPTPGSRLGGRVLIQNIECGGPTSDLVFYKALQSHKL